MYSNKILTQAIDYQKTMFENSYAIVSALQDQGAQMMDLAFDNSSFLPDGSKKICSYWTDFFKQNRETYKAYVGNSFDRVKEYYDTASPVAPVAKPAAAAKKTK